MNELTFTGSRRKFALLTVVSVTFVAIGGSALAAKSSGIGWATVIFFGLGSVVGALTVARPQQLVLDANVFRFSHILARQSFSRRWVDCSPFRAHRITPGTALIVFDSTTPGHKPLRSFNQGLVGGGEGLQASYAGIKPSELADLMNRYRDTAMGTPPPGCPENA